MAILRLLVKILLMPIVLSAYYNKMAYSAYYALYRQYSRAVLDFDCSKCCLLCFKSKMTGIVYICSYRRRDSWMYVLMCSVSRGD